jgi:copper chaperone CopZ
MLRSSLIALVLASGLGLAPSSADACSASDAAAAAAGTMPAAATVATFSVSGMTCGSCALEIRTAVEELKGVKLAQVHMDGTLQVAYDNGQTNVEAIVTAVTQLKKFTIKQA